LPRGGWGQAIGLYSIVLKPEKQMSWSWLNTNAFVGLATILTGVVAFGIYFVQRANAKINAARVLLTEIRNAEERINEIRGKLTANSTADFPSILVSKSWTMYAHLFVRDFDQDELKLIGSFFDDCALIEEMGRRNNNFFWVTTEEKAKVYQQTLAKLVIDSYGSTDEATADKKRKDIFARLDQDPVSYVPVKTVNVMKDRVAKLQAITTSTCGAKLKRLAKMTN
jgi:hypothetical protein